MTTRTAACKLIAILDADREGPARIEALMGVEGLATLILRPAAAIDEAVMKAMVARAQARNLAALVLDDAELAAKVLADGVHVSWSKDVMARFKDTRGRLPRGAVAGADAGRSRHDAMEIGEAGADYVGFGIPGHVGDRATAAERRLELVAWWAEIFEPPVVAFDVADEDGAAALCKAGADFIAVVPPHGLSADEARQWLARMAAAARHDHINA